MTNRKRLLSTSEYDTLVRMNENTSRVTGGRRCIMDVLHGKRDNYVHDRCETYGNCEECIAKWLNEEE